MNIQWYPGHMTKARRDMQNDMKLTDLMIEVLDARAPRATGNPDISELGKGKKRIVVLNKTDLAESSVTADWLRSFRAQNVPCIGMDARTRSGIRELNTIIDGIFREKKERDLKRGILSRPLRVMVAGIPNCGKSTLINTIAGKATVKTGNKPGVTKGDQWIRLRAGLELLDTPGILWPKFEDPETGLMIAFIGSINDMIVDQRELALELIRWLRKDCPALLDARYDCGNLSAAETLAKIAEKRGCLLPGGQPDYDKAAGIVLNEFRSGKIGRISLQKPADGGSAEA